MDLKLFKLDTVEFGVGVGFNLSLPTHKLNEVDSDWRRCVALASQFGSIQFTITIPLWKEKQSKFEED